MARIKSENGNKEIEVNQSDSFECIAILKKRILLEVSNLVV